MEEKMSILNELLTRVEDNKETASKACRKRDMMYEGIRHLRGKIFTDIIELREENKANGNQEDTSEINRLLSIQYDLLMIIGA